MKDSFFYDKLASVETCMTMVCWGVAMAEVIYLDIDGTLRDERTGIPNSAKLALYECRMQNIKIIVCTGRNPASIQEDVYKLPLDGVIAGGGCYIDYHGETLWKKYMKIQTVETVMSKRAEWNFSLVLETEDAIFMDGEAAAFYREDMNRKARGLLEAQKKCMLLRNKILYEDNLMSYYREKPGVHKICVIGKGTGMGTVKELVLKETEIIQDRIWNGKQYLELLPKGCDKGSAVKRLNRRLGISKENTVCFGDSENDIAMMKEANIAVLVGGGNPAVQKYASSVCEPIMEDGIYKELIRRNIIEPDRRRKAHE